ncbi:hypothetical protein LXA43DRAFT_136141 [Ganoderma leucocontextum]|nr:hypothetical protein LXA43DRAFT_136141 [Ganoderma leucocontextum]
MSVSDGPSSDKFPQEEPSYNADRSLATSQKTPLMEQLPLELLLEIFAHFDVAESWHPFFGCVRGSGLAKLMLVCRDWYTLVCTTPEFWRIIDTTEPAEVISLYLQRSRGCMIDVFVSLSLQSDVYPPYDLDRDANAISLVIPYTGRIRSLSVDLCSDHFHLVQPLFEAGLPALQNISIMPVSKTAHRRPRINPQLYPATSGFFWSGCPMSRSRQTLHTVNHLLRISLS